jgi:hypothetical protein
MTVTYQRFTAVLLLIHGSLFLSGICYCLHVLWCAAARMLEVELQQQTNITLIVNPLAPERFFLIFAHPVFKM